MKRVVVSVIIVHYKATGVLFSCLDSLYTKRQKTTFEVIVVDNDVEEPIGKLLLKKFPKVRYVKAPRNVGFGAGNNIGATNVMPIMQLGFTAIPIDIELNTLNVSSRTLKERLRTYPLKMLFLTNLLGFCDDIDEIKKICKENNIILIEDNCESLGTKYKGKLLGNYGLASTFSFYVGHHMSTIEGGAICTNNKILANMLKIVRAHGWDKNLNRETQMTMRNKYKVNSTFYSRYTFYDNGFNLRPTEITGFIGNQQIKYLNEIINKRQRNFKKMAIPLYKQKNYYPMKWTHIDFLSNFAIPLICRSKEIRDALVEKCEGIIEIRPIVGGDMTKQPFFYKNTKKKIMNPNARLVHEQGLYFGNNPELTEKEMKIITTVFSDN